MLPATVENNKSKQLSGGPSVDVAGSAICIANIKKQNKSATPFSSAIVVSATEVGLRTWPKTFCLLHSYYANYSQIPHSVESGVITAGQGVTVERSLHLKYHSLHQHVREYLEMVFSTMA